RLGTVTDRAEHLPPRQHQPHWTSRDPRGSGSQDRMGPRLTLAAEASADERVDDVHVLRLDLELLGKVLCGVADALRCVVYGEAGAVPRRDGSVRLHRIVMLGWRAVDLVDFERRGHRRRCEVA